MRPMVGAEFFSGSTRHTKTLAAAGWDMMSVDDGSYGLEPEYDEKWLPRGSPKHLQVNMARLQVELMIATRCRLCATQCLRSNRVACSPRGCRVWTTRTGQ